MRKYIFAFIVVFLFAYNGITEAAINFSVTPIKYELNLEPGESTTLPASIRNNGTGSVTLPTASSDFQSSGPGGVPSFVRKSELVYPDQQLSTWISIDTSEITLAPGEEKSINFTINVPDNATPGGHYGAVFFKNENSESSTSGKIDINVDYGVIILVNVAGEIEIEGEVENPTIKNSGGGHFNSDPNQEIETTTNPVNGAWYIGKDGTGNDLFINPDSCPLGDFTPSRFDRTCFGTVDNEPLLFNLPGKPYQDGENQNNSVSLNESESSGKNFLIEFNIPVKNTGNSHLKPEGKITLTDENGKILKAVGKQSIVNKQGLVVREEIVDYIPINDGKGNILPKTQRIFESQWEGFPYKDFDDEGNPIIKYLSPSEYYSMKNREEVGFLMPWQRVCDVNQQKNITADIELTYVDENGEEIIFNAAQEFPIQYIEQQVRTNPYVILGLLLLSTAGLMFWFGIRWFFLLLKRQRCWNCKKRIKSHWETCPYCETIQDKKEHKKYLKQKEEE